MDSGEKTEKATPKRRGDERKKGNIYQSRDLTSALGLLGILALMNAAGPYVLGWLAKLFQEHLSGFSSVSDISAASASGYMSEFAIQAGLLSLPFLLGSALLGFLPDAAQTRMNVSFKRIKPDFKHLNPVSGLKRMMNAKALAELFKSVLKVLIAAVILYDGVKSRMPRLLSLSGAELPDALGYICASLYGIAMKVGIAMAAFGVLDYFYQWWSYERQIRMTKQEVKDEYKQTEGDPKIRGRIREQQRKMARLRVVQKVPLADVVIRNPTHYAVAVRYEKDKNRAPVVIAKGKDYLALKIVEAAEAAGVSITENPPLARGLYAAVEIGREIPEEYYQAVAEVLAFVYGLRKGKRQA